MNRILLGLIFIVYILGFAKCDTESAGKPLFLTKYIETGRIDEARKKASVKLPHVKHTESYAGYFTINKTFNSNTFFWYFPSKNNTQNDPLLVWMNGGPGATSLNGLFTENGPFIITKNGTVEMREYSWHNNHNIIYIDNPVGTGFSFTENNLAYVRTKEDAGRDVLTALVQFFELFPELKKNDFYVTGESYAGKYIPAVCHEIKVHNQRADFIINLKGLAIGNGLIDPVNQVTHYSDQLYPIGLLDSAERDQIIIVEEKIRKLIAEKKYEAANDLRRTLFTISRSSQPLIKNITGFDYYFNLLQTKAPAGLSRFADYVTKPDIRRALHVGDSKFNKTSTIVQKYLKGDFTRSAADSVADLLDDYKVLIYHGQLDLTTPYVGTEIFLASLNWTGAHSYKAAPKKVWRVENDIAGYTKTAKNLNFILLRNAGHYVPMDQPSWAFDMITRFTRNLEF